MNENSLRNLFENYRRLGDDKKKANVDGSDED
jgi:hypothetical protein